MIHRSSALSGCKVLRMDMKKVRKNCIINTTKSRSFLTHTRSDILSGISSSLRSLRQRSIKDPNYFDDSDLDLMRLKAIESTFFNRGKYYTKYRRLNAKRRRRAQSTKPKYFKFVKSRVYEPRKKRHIPLKDPKFSFIPKIHEENRKKYGHVKSRYKFTEFWYRGYVEQSPNGSDNDKN